MIINHRNGSSCLGIKTMSSCVEVTQFTNDFQLFLGTLWCGAGDVAQSEEELGYFKDTDECCRIHDNCKLKIFPGRVSYGLRNIGLFVRYDLLRQDK